MAFVGYALVSTKDQETDLQLDALHRAGVSEVYQEKASSVGTRPQLRRCLAALRPGDVSMVYKLDRVARSLPDLLSILAGIKAAGAAVDCWPASLDFPLVRSLDQLVLRVSLHSFTKNSP